MPSRSIPRWKPLPQGIRYVADSDPDALCHGTGNRAGKPVGTPNMAAIARAACLSKGALNRVFDGTRPWAGGDTVLRVATVAAKAREIPLEEALCMIFEPVEFEVGQ